MDLTLTNRTDKVTIRPILQTLLDAEPVTAAEMRELIIRHVMVNYSNTKACMVTQKLLEAYDAITGQRKDDAGGDRQAGLAMRDKFVEGLLETTNVTAEEAAQYWIWPPSIPKMWSYQYPRDILVQVAHAIGLRVGMDINKTAGLHGRDPGSN